MNKMQKNMATANEDSKGAAESLRSPCSQSSPKKLPWRENDSHQQIQKILHCTKSGLAISL
jgi:hypothetical protein